MTPEGAALRPHEIAMTIESCRAVIDLLRCIDEIIAAGNALAELADSTWSHPAIDAWHDAVERGRDRQECVDAYRKFEPCQWWSTDT